jgi:DnaJ-domain-containing protein 1
LPRPGKDYTAEIIEFLKETHGNVRRDGEGDFYYNSVSTISLHFLLQSKLPAQEVLWRWYLHFDRGRSESIYRTLPPQDDEQFLAVLETCSFRWNPETVRQSGLVFLRQHRAEVYLALEEFLSMRMDGYRTMSDPELREALTPRMTWSEAHLRKLIRRIQTQPLSRDHRHALYGLFESDYVRATARHLLDEAATEAFWKSPPPELEALHARFAAFGRMLTETSRRLGVHVSRDAFERMNGQRFRGEYGDYTGKYRAGEGAERGARRPARTTVESQFAVLGLVPGATLYEVRSAYREMVKRHHPDQGGAIQDFLRLQEAYEFLLTQVF